MGLLQPLPLAEKLWVLLSLNFISCFPKMDGLSLVIVVVNYFSKYLVFVPTPKACFTKVAVDLFYNEVNHFNSPANIISDRAALLIGRFWTYLFELMGFELKFSTTNHLQMDG